MDVESFKFSFRLKITIDKAVYYLEPETLDHALRVLDISRVYKSFAIV